MTFEPLQVLGFEEPQLSSSMGLRLVVEGGGITFTILRAWEALLQAASKVLLELGVSCDG